LTWQASSSPRALTLNPGITARNNSTNAPFCQHVGNYSSFPYDCP
jgi:hypothetical protein